MATLIKISQLPSAVTPLAGDEMMTIIQGGVSKKITAQAVLDVATSQISDYADAAANSAAESLASANSAAASALLSSAQVSLASGHAESAAAFDASANASEALAKSWATKLVDEVVAEQGYSARQYALNSAASADLAISNASLAEASAISAADSEANSLSYKNTSQTSAATASTKASQAALSASAAATSEANAATSEANSLAHKNSASTSAATATTKASESAASASAAATSATNAGVSATNSAASEANALSYKNSASTSATTATTQAGIATTKAGEAATSAASASASALSASTSESNALSYKNTALASSSNATDQAAISTAQAGIATTQAGIATTKAGEASSSASAAAIAQVAAESALSSTLAAFDSFDDRYLGAKAFDPATDNDSNALVAGALYYCTASGSEGMRVYTGSAWVAAYVSGGGTLLSANNLSDLTNVSTARANLGLAAVASSGAYSDLTGTPTLFSGSYTDLTNKPVLFSGAYADLTGKPTIPTVPTNVSAFANDAGYLTSVTETDPVFAASPAHSITNTQITNWDTSHGWGNHATAGYVTDGSLAVTLDAYVLADNALVYYQPKSEMASYLTISAANSGYQAKDDDLTAIAGLNGSAGILKKTAANTWTLDTSSYLTSYTETDPVFVASAAYSITGADKTNWNAAYGWGNHASAGYETSSHAASTYQTQAGMSGYLSTSGKAADADKLDGNDSTYYLKGYVVLRQPDTLSIYTGVDRWYAPAALTINTITARLATAADATVTVVIKKNSGGTVTSTTLTLAANATKTVITPAIGMAIDDYITVDVTSVGTTAKGAGLTLNFEYLKS